VNPNGPIAAETVIAAAPALPGVTARAASDGTIIVRAANVAVRPDPAAARQGQKVSAAGPLAANDQISVEANSASDARHRRPWSKLT
jgi:hypothetical protein